MTRKNLQIIALCFALLFSCSMLQGEEPPKPAALKPPAIKLRSAATITLGEADFLSLTLEVTNPNDAALIYTGYTPDSFDPPLTQGHIIPLHHLELQQGQEWKPYLMGFCGTGLDNLELAPKSPATFDVGVPAGDWQAVKVSIGHHPGWSENEETATTTLWSVVFTREEIEKQLSDSTLEKPAQ